MDHKAVLKAVASDTLFIHGSINGGGGSEFHAHGSVPASSPALRLVGESNRPAERCTASCGAPPLAPAVAPSSETGMAAATAVAAVASVCDRSCYTGGENGARFGGHLCGAGDVAEFGAHCRTCFSDLEEARAAEDWLAEEERLALGRRKNKKKSAVEVSLGGGGGGGGGPTSKRRRVLRADGGGWTERQEGGEAEGKGKRKRENDLLEEDSGSEGAGRGQGGRGNDEVGDEGEEMVEQRRHVIMCDTMMPPPPAAVADCSLKCQRKTDTVSRASERARRDTKYEIRCIYIYLCIDRFMFFGTFAELLSVSTASFIRLCAAAHAGGSWAHSHACLSLAGHPWRACSRPKVYRGRYWFYFAGIISVSQKPYGQRNLALSQHDLV